VSRLKEKTGAITQIQNHFGTVAGDGGMDDHYCSSVFSLQPKHLIWLTVVNRKQNFLSPFLGVFSEYEFKA
jgi:hypothetical protein